jgi:hypothetical protein
MTYTTQQGMISKVAEAKDKTHQPRVRNGNPNDKQGSKPIGPAFKLKYYGMFSTSRDLRWCLYILASCLCARFWLHAA